MGTFSTTILIQGKEKYNGTIDWKGLNPAPVTLFKDNGDVDFEANARLAKWLAVYRRREEPGHPRPRRRGHLPHPDEQVELIRDLSRTRRRCRSSPASPAKAPRSPTRRRSERSTPAPPPRWSTRTTAGCVSATRRAPRRTATRRSDESGLPVHPVPVPGRHQGHLRPRHPARDRRPAGVIATKNGVRNMKRWYTEIPALARELPELQILSCHDEWLLPTMFDIDGLLVGYGGMAPEPLFELLAAGKAQDYNAARAVHERLLPVTRAVYHRGSHMEGTVALKLGLRPAASSRTPHPLAADAARAGAEEEIRAALKAAGLAGRPPRLTPPAVTGRPAFLPSRQAATIPRVGRSPTRRAQPHVCPSGLESAFAPTTSIKAQKGGNSSCSIAGGRRGCHGQGRDRRPPRAAAGHPPGLLDPKHHRRRDLLRRLHRHRHRLCDAVLVREWGLNPADRLDPVGGLPRSALRRRPLRLARRADRPPTACSSPSCSSSPWTSPASSPGAAHP